VLAYINPLLPNITTPGPDNWKSLPRIDLKGHSLTVFKHRLKTLTFNKAFHYQITCRWRLHGATQI